MRQRLLPREHFRRGNARRWHIVGKQCVFWFRIWLGCGWIAQPTRSVGSRSAVCSTPIKAAYLYWAVITNGAPPAAVKKPTIARCSPTTSAAAILTGAAVGTGASPCWTGTRSRYLGPACRSASLVAVPGFTRCASQLAASGDPSGGDPWYGTQVLPLMEGASLVMVGKGASTIALYDIGLAGTTFSGSQSYSLLLPVAYTGTTLDITNIGADGQHRIYPQSRVLSCVQMRSPR